MFWMYGGAFNPPTKAHEHIIYTVKRIIKEETLVLVPVGNTYHKEGLVDMKHRIEMLNLLKLPVIIDSLEAQEFNGTIDTLKRLEDKYHHPFGFIIGSDQLPYITTWIDYKTLFNTFPVMIISRPSSDIKPYLPILDSLESTYTIIALDLDISSTQFRKGLKNPTDIIDSNVLKYIKANSLYEENDVSTRIY